MNRNTPAHAALSAVSCISYFAGLASAEPVDRFWGAWLSDGDLFTVDVNTDGIPDLEISYAGASVYGSLGWEARINGASPQADVRFAGFIDADSSSVHTRLGLGAEINETVNAGLSVGVVAYEVGGGVVGSGAWADQLGGFVGFSLLSAQGNRHYGWVQARLVNEADPGAGRLLIERIGYETTANTPILAGDTGAGPQCSVSDLAAPGGVLDLADIAAMINQKISGELDLTGEGVCDLADISLFITAFQTGCHLAE